MKPILLILAVLLTPSLSAQLDPTRNLPSTPQSHSPLPEQYLWTASDITIQRPDHNKFPWNRPQLRTDPHFFRTRFPLTTLPKSATLYLAGPRAARVWINGHLAATFTSDPDAPINFHVFRADVAPYLHPGPNTLAIEAVRGHGVVSATGSATTEQIAYGEVLAAKILPAAPGIEAPALTDSTPAWKSTAIQTPGWERPTFDDKSWPAAATLGPIESDPDLLQWNADAGMYEWPGYLGISPALRTLALPPTAITHTFAGSAQLIAQPGTPITLTSFTPATDAESPAILLDFGREIAGRILIQSSSPCESTVSVAYGESELEALATGLTPGQKGGNYLGTNLLHVPPRGIARGPKSAFRFVRLRFLRGCQTLTFPSIQAEAIFYPVTHTGSFASSDPLLNKIWETGAYTAHLCMQDGIWDAPKRDRGRWVGDLDIEGRVISTAFGDSALLEDTLNRLANDTPPGQHVNGIAAYTALWLTTLDTLFLHSGDRAFLETQRVHIHQLLETRLDKDIGPNDLIRPAAKGWDFVDWAPGLYGLSADTRMGVNLQYLRGYAAATRLLQALDDPAAATYEARTKVLTAAAQLAYRDHLGTTPQLNTLGVLTLPGAWLDPLEIKQDAPTDPVISPYFGTYLLDALALTDRRPEALAWIRTYWGGMLAEGATSFWESYDLRWPKDNPHLSLQADGTSGFFVSLAHGWSAGPTAWLSENILGILPLTPGYAIVQISPNLLNLDWAQGTVPTPHGPITVAIDKSTGLTLDLPPGVEAHLTYAGHLTTITKPGHYTFEH